MAKLVKITMLGVKLNIFEGSLNFNPIFSSIPFTFPFDIHSRRELKRRFPRRLETENETAQTALELNHGRGTGGRQSIPNYGRPRPFKLN